MFINNQGNYLNKSEKEVEFVDIVNHGIPFLELVKEVNEKRRRSRLSPVSTNQVIELSKLGQSFR